MVAKWPGIMEIVIFPFLGDLIFIALLSKTITSSVFYNHIVAHRRTNFKIFIEIKSIKLDFCVLFPIQWYKNSLLPACGKREQMSLHIPDFFFGYDLNVVLG